jgi:hypothetical protein
MSFGAQGSSSKQGSQQSQEVWQEQRNFLQSLYGQGQQLSNQQQGGISSAAQNIMQGLQPGLGAAFSNASQMAQGQDTAGQFFQSRLGQANPGLESVIGSLGEDINRFTGMTLGGEDSNAAMMGGGSAAGGARHALERGAIQDAGIREFSQGASDLRFADYARQSGDAAALQQGQFRGQGAVGSLTPLMQNLGMMPFQAAWMPLQQQAAILGRPTVLGSGSSFGKSSSFGFNMGI